MLQLLLVTQLFLRLDDVEQVLHINEGAESVPLHLSRSDRRGNKLVVLLILQEMGSRFPLGRRGRRPLLLLKLEHDLLDIFLDDFVGLEFLGGDLEDLEDLDYDQISLKLRE